MSNWSLVELGEVAQVKGGKRLPKGMSLQEKNNGSPYLRIVDWLDGYFDASKLMYVPDAARAQISRYTVSTGDVFISIAGTVGRISLIPAELDGAFLTENAAKISVDSDLVLPQFLKFALSSPQGQEEISSLTVGSTQPKLALQSIKSIRIPLPPLSEQRAVAEVLGALDDKIAANNKTIQLADSLTSALAEDAFSRGNFVPLASIAEITMGNSPKGETLNEDGEGLAFFQGIRDFGVRYPQERVSSTAPTRFAKELDTLFSVRAPVGTVNLAGMPCSIGRGISALSSKTETPYALFQAVRASKIWERYNAEGTVFGSINRKQLEQSEIPWVFHSERYELESTLAGLERLLRTATVMNETISSIRDTLLPQLMSGKLRVREAEAVVEDVL